MTRLQEISLRHSLQIIRSITDVESSSSTLDNVRANGYVRWYVTDATGNLVSDMADWGFDKLTE